MSLLIVALTGGIATGKSVVARVLKQRGCYIHSADRAAHDLMRPGRPVWQRVVDHFGEKILNPDRTINRQMLGAVVFADAGERRYLNRLVHPLVLEKKTKMIRRLEKMGKHKIFVSEAALTIESKFVTLFDKAIVVTCPEKTQIQRLMARDRITRSEARKKVHSQMPSAEKIKYADYLVDTSGTTEETVRQAEAIYRALLVDYRRKNRQKGSEA